MAYRYGALRKYLRVRVTAVVVLVLVAIGAPSLYWYGRLAEVRDRYDTECQTPTPSSQSTTSNASQSSSDSSGIASMKEQSTLLLNWGLAALGAIIALITTTATHRFLAIRWLFLLHAPTLSFLAGSLWAGLLFQRRVTFLQLNACLATGTPNDLLLAQTDLLLMAIGVMAVFGVVCLIQIVAGVVDPGEATP